MNIYEDTNRVSKEAMDNALKSFSAVTKGFQQIAAETNEFTKRSYEQTARMLEQLMQTKSLEKAIEVQNDYAKAAYQSWVSQATRVGEIYADMAKESYKPFERTAVTSANTGAQVANAGAQAVKNAA